MKAIILARVSTEEQREAGNSLPSQIQRLEKYCADKGLEVSEKIEFDESAWKLKRKQFSELIKKLSKRKKKVALCCDKIDRLLRNFVKELIIIEEMRNAGLLELHFPSDNLVIHRDSPANDLFRFSMGVTLAKYYSDSTSDNIKRANENLVRKGIFPSKAPFGYKNITDQEGNKSIVVDTEKSELVKQVFDLYSTGDWSMEIIRISLDKKISLRQIECILNNPFYYGYMRLKGMIYPHKYEPIVSFELWKQCEEIRLGYSSKPNKFTEKPFIFRGLIKCKKCGCLVTAELKKGRYIYYHCTNYHGNCEKIYVSEQELLDQIYPVFDRLVLPKKDIDKIISSLKIFEKGRFLFQEEEVKKLSKTKEILEKRQKSMYADKLDGLITREFYAERFNEYQNEMLEIDSKLNSMSKAGTKYYITANRILEICQGMGKIFESSKVDEKREILKILLSNFELCGKKLEYKLNSPFKEVYLYPTHHLVQSLGGVLRTFDDIEKLFPKHLFPQN
jgi:site-specific DNA recombinase